MSWKKIATVVVCALMASSAWAGPTLDLRNTGLDGSGDWVWELRATPDPTLFQVQTQGTGGSLAIELGLQSSLGNILSITPNPGVIPNAAVSGGDPTNPVEFENPGNSIFTWEKLTDVSLAQDGSNMKPVGILLGSVSGDTQSGTVTNPNQAFLALGTTFFESTDVVPTNGWLIATVTTTGPSTTTSLTSALSVLGSYGGNGAIAQSTGATTAVLFDDYVGTATRTVLEGDANVSGGVTIADLNILAGNFGKPGSFHWGSGDFNGSTGGSGEVSIADLNILAAKFGQSGGSNTPLTIVGSPGAGSSTAIPEPSSVILACLALLTGFGLVRRK
jgi:hypothetical protein